MMLAEVTRAARDFSVMQPTAQPSEITAEFLGYVGAIAGALDDTAANLLSISDHTSKAVYLTPLDGFGVKRTWLGRSGMLGGMGDLMTLLAEMASAFDEMTDAAKAVLSAAKNARATNIPVAPKDSWGETYAGYRATPAWRGFLFVFADAIDALNAALDAAYPPVYRGFSIE